MAYLKWKTKNVMLLLANEFDVDDVATNWFKVNKFVEAIDSASDYDEDT